MKIYKLPQLADAAPDGICRLGPQDLEAGAVSLVYARVRPGEAGRAISAPAAEDRVLCVIKGSLKVKCGRSSFSVSAGEAFCVKAGQSVFLDNTSREEAVYIAAGGASTAGAAKSLGNNGAGAAPAAKTPEEAAQPEKKAADDEFEITRDDEADEGGGEKSG